MLALTTPTASSNDDPERGSSLEHVLKYENNGLLTTDEPEKEKPFIFIS
jgi:hypothetical protein